jgi:hypothetical protein
LSIIVFDPILPNLECRGNAQTKNSCMSFAIWGQ